MPKPYTRVNSVAITRLRDKEPTYFARIEEWESDDSGEYWVGAYDLASGKNEVEVRNQAAKLLREWAGEIDPKGTK
jgi:hypothetical protein